MLIDELKEQLKQIEPDIETIQQYWRNAGNEERFAKLEAETQQESFWQHPKQAEISRQLQRIREQRERYQYIIITAKEAGELIDLFGEDEAELRKVQVELAQLVRVVAEFKISLLLSDPRSDANCFVNINAGAGGTESQDWAEMLLRMYVRFCERAGLKVSIVDDQPGDEAGIKSATLFVRGDNAYGLLKSEHGVHRLVRISPYDASKRRHTSFAAVTLTPEMPDVEVTINPDDLRIDTYRSSGAGGQHVNVTDSAVRITHLPTGIVVQCQNERSQMQNKETAMRMLRAKLAQRAEEEREAELRAGTEKRKIEWGSQIRSYVLHPYKMVKDHRTCHESPQPDHVLDGELLPFIEAYLIAQGS